MAEKGTVEIELGLCDLRDEREQLRQVLEQESEQQRTVEMELGSHDLPRQHREVLVPEQEQEQEQEEEEPLIKKLFDWETYFPTRQEFRENISLTILFLVFLSLVCVAFVSSFFLQGRNRSIGYFSSIGFVGIHEILSLLRFRKDLKEKGVRLRFTYLLMLLFCCVYFFFVILDALLQQCTQHSSCGCDGPLIVYYILQDLIIATWMLVPFWALSALPLVLVALLQVIFLVVGRTNFFENSRWVSLIAGMIGQPIVLGIIYFVSSLLILVVYVVDLKLFFFCTDTFYYL